MLKNKLKRWLAVAVWAVMMCGVLGLLPAGTIKLAEPIVAEAYNWDLVDDYPSKYKAAALDALVDEWKYYNRECTSFVAWRLNSRNGVAFHNWYGGVNFGNATTWGGAARSIGITVDMNPAPGSVFWQEGTYGHVAWVNTVNGDGTVTIEEYNWNWDGAYHYRTVAASSASGYIHIADINLTPTGKEMSAGAGQTIPDGEYHIISELNQYYGLACGGRTNTEKGTNVFLQNWGEAAYGTHLENIGATDTWKVTYLNNGFYRIQQNGVNVSLDVSGADLHRGTNVQVWENHNDTPEQWSINKTAHGYTIQSRRNSYYLDVDGGIAENGRNIQVWEGNDTKGQSWCFVPYNPDHSVKDGIYRLHSEIDDGFVLDTSGNIGEYEVGTNVQLWGSTGDDLFALEYADSGYYRIKEVTSGLYVEVWNGDGGANFAKWGTNIQLNNKSDSRGQFWSVQNMHDKTYTFISMLNGYALDLEEGKCVNGQNISVHTLNTITSSPAQSWALEPVKLQSIKVDKVPDKTTYYPDEAFDPTGITVNAKYSGDYSFKIAKGLTYEYDFSKSGKNTVTVSYDINGQTLTDTFEVTVNEIDFKGSGTKSDPYLIENKSDLEKLRDLVNSEDYAPAFKSCYYLQTVDIDLNDEKWIPIGKVWANGEQTASLRFEGHYDGGQHWIYGLNVDEETKFAGLFGCVNSGTVENLAVEGTVSGKEASVGGIVGEIQGATISGCCFIGDVTGGSTAAGGIVGYMWQSGTVQNCYHIGSVKTSDTHSAGGVIGRIQSNEIKNAVCTVENCYHIGQMESGQTYAKTLVGEIDKVDTNVGQRIELINCYGINTDGGLYAGDKPDTDTAQAVKESVMKLMAPTLGDAYVKNTDSNYLDGYPVFPWQTRLVGDVNVDGTFNISDAVLLQKWLLAVPDTHLANWKAADMCEDNKLDVFDLCMMKSKLING